MDKFTDKLDSKIEMDMTFAEWSKLTAALAIMAVDDEDVPDSSKSHCIECLTTFIAKLTSMLTMPKSALRLVMDAAQLAVGDAMDKAVREAAEEVDAQRERKSAIERLKAEAEQIAKEAAEGTK